VSVKILAVGRGNLHVGFGKSCEALI